jgi:hypothetical protein
MTTLNTNPIVVDATDTTLWSGAKLVRQAQWIDDAGDLIANDEIVITLNGTTITYRIAAIDNTVSTTHCNIGPFNRGMVWEDVGVTLPRGIFVIWLE